MLAAPKEFDTDPELQAAFQSAGGAGIPDPASYDQWFAQADTGRRKTAVGSRRYNTMANVLAGDRPPEWTDFVDEDGKLLSLGRLKNESIIDRVERKMRVERVIRQRAELIRQIANKGFVTPGVDPLATVSFLAV